MDAARTAMNRRPAECAPHDGTEGRDSAATSKFSLQRDRSHVGGDDPASAIAAM